MTIPFWLAVEESSKLNEDLLIAKFEGVVAMQVGDFIGEIELVLRPADTIFAAIPQASCWSGKRR